MLFAFLHHIEAQNANPDSVHSAFQGFFDYIVSRGYHPSAVAISLKRTIGHHRLAHMALKGPPNFVEKIIFQIGKWMRELEAKGKVYQIIIGFLWALQTSISPFLLNLDYVKDLVLYLILRETVLRIEKTCEQLRFDCLAASGTEQDLLLALLIIFCISIFSTSAMSFFERKQFFKTNRWLDILFCCVSPLLPGIYHFKVNRSAGYEKENTLQR